MNEVAFIGVIADAAISAGAVLIVVIILAIVVLGVSIWLYRRNLEYRRVLYTQRVVKKCPYCNAEMGASVNYCPNCGKQVPQITTTTTT